MDPQQLVTSGCQRRINTSQFNKDNVSTLYDACRTYQCYIFSEHKIQEHLNDSTCHRLGRGTYGRCYLVDSPPSCPEKWVIKCVNNDKIAVQSLVQEIQLLSVLKQVKGIQRLVGVCPEQFAIVTQYAGQTLEATLNTFSQKDRVNILYQVVRTLMGIHTQDWVYLDLKTNNVCVKKLADGSLKVTFIDFGLALRHGDSHTFPEGTVCEHVAPEILYGHCNTFAADVYSLAVLIPRLLIIVPGHIASWVIQAKHPHCGIRPSLCELEHKLKTCLNQWDKPQCHPCGNSYRARPTFQPSSSTHPPSSQPSRGIKRRNNDQFSLDNIMSDITQTFEEKKQRCN